MYDLEIRRHPSNDTTTLGKFFIRGEKFCLTLEDKIRPYGVKIHGKTAFASGVFKVTITYSNRFKRDMPLIYNMDDYSLEEGGKRFTGLRLHGGNTHLDTAGCPLVAYNPVNDYTIQGTAEKALTKRIKELIAESPKDYIYICVSDNWPK